MPVLQGEPYRATIAAAACIGILAATGCGGASETEIIGPDLIRCATEVSLDPASVPADGARVTVSIHAARECEWTAATEASWLQLSPSSGQGDGTIAVTAAPNTRASARTAGIRINDQLLNLTQEGRPCRFDLDPTRAQMNHQGGRGSIAVATADGCTWQASTSASWVSVPGAVRTGPGSLDFEVEANDGPAREAVIRIADQDFAITQSTFGSSPAPQPQPQPGGLPAPMGLVTTIVSDTRVDLSWTNADPTAQTQVYRDGAVVATKGGGVTTHQDTGLTRATSYTYVVRHVKNGVVGLDSNNAVGRPVFFATGGTVHTAGGYRHHIFNGSGSFVVTQGGTIDEIIIIGGGAGGGGSQAGTDWGSGGGGAGGVRVITMKVEAPGTQVVVIGSGGGGGGSGTSNPVRNGGVHGIASSYGAEIALGGGAGAGAGRDYSDNPGGNGGSGGGGAGAAGGAGTSGHGNSGGAGFPNRGGAAGGGGGGGKGGAGGSANGGQGGNGGAGYSTWNGTVAAGGKGGRGAGGTGGAGVAPGDGGHGNDSGGNGGRGANGAVLVRYRQ